MAYTSKSITGGSQGRNSSNNLKIQLEKCSPEDWSWELGHGELESFSHHLNVDGMEFSAVVRLDETPPLATEDIVVPLVLELEPDLMFSNACSGFSSLSTGWLMKYWTLENY